MNTTFQKSKNNSTVEWYTPLEIIHSLGKFDLDPASPVNRKWDTAKQHYNKIQNGLIQPWKGRVWLNPPYESHCLKQFMRKMAEHNNGIALVFNRCDSEWFHEYVFNAAAALLFLRKRIHFLTPEGTPGNRPGCGSVLIAYGEENMYSLAHCGLEGKLVYLHSAEYEHK